MKKKLLVLTVLVMALSVCLAFAGIAGAAATVEGQAEYFMGEYANMFEDRRVDLGDAYVDYLQANKNAVIVYGTVSGETEGYEYGIVLYPEGSTYESADAKFYKANSVQDGKFGVAISLSGNFVNSGKYCAKAYVIEEGLPLVASNVVASTNGATFTTTTEQYSAPTGIAISSTGVVSWDAVQGATIYRIQVQKSTEKDLGDANGYVHPWVSVASVDNETSWDVSSYLKTLTAAQLHEYEDRYLNVRVAADGEEKAVSEYTVAGNVFGVSGTANLRLKVVENVKDLGAYSSVEQKANYLVLANDLVISNPVMESATNPGFIQNSKYTIAGNSLSNATLNGLGRTISYAYNDLALQLTDASISTGFGFGGLFSGVENAKVMNLYFDVALTTQNNFDDYFFSLFATSNNGQMYNSYFKVRAHFVNHTPSASVRTRLGLANSGVASWNTCVFDMVTYDKNGSVFSAGKADYYDQVLSPIGANITNCSYITQGASLERYWAGRGSETANYDTLSQKYSTYETFMTAYDSFAESTKKLYEDAGFYVDSSYIKFYDNVIVEPSYDKATNLSYDGKNSFTWDPVNNVDSYEVKVYSGPDVVDTISTTNEKFNVSEWLVSLDSATLASLDGKSFSIGVVATGSNFANSEETIASLTNVTKATSVTIEVVTSADEFTALKDTNGHITADKYIVLANDISFTGLNMENLIKSPISSASGDVETNLVYSLVKDFKGTIDGLGHKFTYVVNDENMDVEKFALFNRMFSAYAKNTVFKGDVTRNFKKDDAWTCALAYQVITEVAYIDNCYFDFLMTTIDDTTETGATVTKTRTCVVQQTSSGTYFENCIFNIRSRTSQGVVRVGNSSDAEGEVTWTNAAASYLTNCAYIAHEGADTTTIKKNFSTSAHNTNVGSYLNLASFTTAWADDELVDTINSTIISNGIAPYVAAGWSVDGTTIKLHGSAIN